jgi:hypothetical protein
MELKDLKDPEIVDQIQVKRAKAPDYSGALMSL